MATKLIGSTRAYNATTSPVSFLRAAKFTALFTGTMNEFKIECNGNGNVKVAVYADNAGTIAGRLWVQNTSQAVAAGWNTITVSPGLLIVKDTVYWLGCNNDTANIIRYLTPGGTMGYVAADYTTVGCPASPAGLTPLSYEYMMQGWENYPGRNNAMMF